jgi:hypothetical protein
MHARARSAALSAFALYLAGGAAIGTIGAVAALGWEGRPQDIALVLGVPPAIRVSLAITGTLVLFVVLWQIGARLQPPGEALVLPFVFATTARVIAYAPLPFGMLLTMVVGSLYWVIAIGGAIWYRRTSGATTPPRRPLNLMLSAYTLPILLILIVRLMTTGIDFGM